MNIKILSDSTCDLSAQLLADNNITLVPLTVVKDGQQYKDGVTITPADIFAHVAAGGALCSTAANSIGEYADMLEAYAPNYDGVILITIGSSFSTCYQSACLAAEDYPNVRVIDSRNLSTGQGLVVLKACELAKTATDLDALANELRGFTEKVEASFLVDKLDYLAKGGRCSAVTALGANLLNLKPCIDVKDGKMGVTKKYRGKYEKCLASYVKERLADRDDIDRSILFVTKTQVSDECYAAVMNAVTEYGHFENVYETLAGCTVSCHCGPGTLGVLFVRK
ncbi:MAG: DegV family protein [Oscillospiraceae bacterium]|nr:DegV family protein [Oscillospiraceae bacterium]